MWGDSRDAELSGVRTEQQRAPLERDGFFVVLEGSPVGDLGVPIQSLGAHNNGGAHLLPALAHRLVATHRSQPYNSVLMGP